MNCKQILAVAAIAVLAICLMPSVDATEFTSNPSETIELDSMNGGSFQFGIDCDNSGTLTVTVTDGRGGPVVTEQTYDVEAGPNTITVNIGSMGDGDHRLYVQCETSDGFTGSFSVDVHVNKNLLSNWATYAVIAVVVIVIVIFAYLKMRDKPKEKPEMTFEELEAQRKAEMAEKAERKQKKEKAPASTTERKRYVSKSEKAETPKVAEKEPPKAEEPKPAKTMKLMERSEKKKDANKPTFEELEAQKQAEKAEKQARKAEKAAEKKSSGKTERERYLEEKRKKKEQE